ncbi:hypothetical protein BDU57DRAFT_494022 [Ampelomyces quisqualis]|uniref:Uncharacterized protein n=1 Tax=Ampelomyces quisqualis TaxID=50730 RepID=A0A6A5QQ18_AMPQU|nr:hypothetical protein BDU57DRAFT_494022 [Ampelomyces quisqualis]
MGFKFNQALRFRRALVGDVFTALQKSANVKIGGGGGALGTPDSARDRAGKRGTNGSRCMAERKRRCKREDESDTDIATENSDRLLWDDQAFLAEVMHELIGRADTDVEGYLRGDKSVGALADIVHDGLVSVWDGPAADHGRVPEGLEKKRIAWV